MKFNYVMIQKFSVRKTYQQSCSAWGGIVIIKESMFTMYEDIDETYQLVFFHDRIY